MVHGLHHLSFSFAPFFFPFLKVRLAFACLHSDSISSVLAGPAAVRELMRLDVTQWDFSGRHQFWNPVAEEATPLGIVPKLKEDKLGEQRP